MTSIQKHVKTQSGSTLTGFIMGLVIGLSIAVVVALVINKTSTPFTNKNGVADKSAEVTTQMQDPNQPMYGGKVSVAQPIAKPATNPTTNPATTDAITTIAEKPPAIEDKSIYFIQVGAFNAQAEAESTRARLALIGVEAAVSEKTGDGASMYRVRVGPFENADTMNKMRAKLTENGVEVSIIKSAK